jgi:hypothetical protein
VILRPTSKQASNGPPNRVIKQAEGCFACLLAYQQVCIAAKTYELHRLQQLVKHKTEQFGTDMNIFDTVKVIKEDFSKLPGDAT